jgi:uncharacterized membrane protein YfcA
MGFLLVLVVGLAAGTVSGSIGTGSSMIRCPALMAGVIRGTRHSHYMFFR